jgi:hypothetical protein
MDDEGKRWKNTESADESFQAGLIDGEPVHASSRSVVHVVDNR